MKVASLLAIALVLFIALPRQIQAKKTKPPKLCLGNDGNEYKVGKGYVDKDACVRYVCARKKKKLYMKEIQLPCSTTSTSPIITIEPETPVNVTALEINVQSLNDSLQSLQATMHSMQINVQSVNDTMKSLHATVQSVLDTMTNIQSTVNKQETCLADVTSAECPSKDEKTSVVDAIKENKDAIETYHPTPLEPINLVVIGGNGLYDPVMIGPAGICSRTMPSLRVDSDSEAVYIDNQIMVCGGHLLKKACKVLLKSGIGEWDLGPEMNEERSYFRLVKAGDEVFAIGGHESSSMEKYSKGKWTLLNPMPSKRFESCTVYWKTINSLVNIAGAYGLDSVKAFNLQTEEWSNLPPLPYHLRLHDCAVLNETIYVVGGYPHRGKDVLKYTYGADIWEELSGRTNHAWEYHTVNAMDGKLFVIGSNKIERMKDDETWETMPWILSEERWRHAVAEVPEKDFPCHVEKK